MKRLRLLRRTLALAFSALLLPIREVSAGGIRLAPAPLGHAAPAAMIPRLSASPISAAQTTAISPMLISVSADVSASPAASFSKSPLPAAAEASLMLRSLSHDIEDHAHDAAVLDKAFDVSVFSAKGADATVGEETAAVSSLGRPSERNVRPVRAVPPRPSPFSMSAALFGLAPSLSAPAWLGSFLSAADDNPLLWVAAAAGAAAAVSLAVWAYGAYRERKFMNMSSSERRQALSSDSWRDRRLAARAMGKKGEAEMYSDILIAAAQNDKETRVRAAAVEVLGDGRVRHAAGPLAAMLENRGEDEDLRLAAAEALGSIGLAASLDPLVKVLSEEGESDSLREAAAGSLGRLGDARAVAPLDKVLAERAAEQDDLAVASLRALLVIGAPTALSALGSRAQSELVERIRSDGEAESSIVEMMMDLYEETYDDHDGEGKPEGRLIAGLERAFAGVSHPNAARVLAETLRLIREDEDTESETRTSYSNGKLTTTHETRDADADETLEMAGEELELDGDTEDRLRDMEASRFRATFAASFGADVRGLEGASDDPDLRRPYLLALGLTPQDISRLTR